MPSGDESPGSPLSSIASDQLSETYDDDDVPPHARSRDDTISIDSPSASTPIHHAVHPSKRRRTGAYERAAGTPLSVATGADDETIPFARPTSPGAESISSDSSADVPNSPYAHLAAKDDDDGGIGSGDQVTVCKWTGCNAGDLGNMDALVSHLHEIHMPHRQKKYSCEWVDCARKGQPQASGYALRAHMRSHTREKPFYCALPECDRSFTRSDALAKHMRTVHETEALRPSDPIPKGHSGGLLGAGVGGNGNLKRIKLVFGGKEKPTRPGLGLGELPPLPSSRKTSGIHGSNGVEVEVDIDSMPFQLPMPDNYYPKELREALTEDEILLPPSQLYKLLNRQIYWAEQEGLALNQELSDLVDNAPDLLDGLHPFKKRTLEGVLTNVDERSDYVRKSAWRKTEPLLEDIMNVETEPTSSSQPAPNLTDEMAV